MPREIDLILPTLDQAYDRKSWYGANLKGAILAVMLLSGCGEVAPIGRRPKSDQFLTHDRLVAMAVPGTPRDAIRKQFGEPYAVRQDGSALAFLRQETTERRILVLAVIVPFWERSSVTYFQVQGIWFDPDGKVIQARLWNGHDGPYGGNPYGRSVPSQHHVLLWLEKEAPATRK